MMLVDLLGIRLHYWVFAFHKDKLCTGEAIRLDVVDDSEKKTEFFLKIIRPIRYVKFNMIYFACKEHSST